LKQRSRHIIRSIDRASIDLSDEQLDLVINACNGSVKLALMKLMSGLDVEESARRLQDAGGVLKAALKACEDEHSSKTPDSSQTCDENIERPKQSSGLAVCIDGGGSKCAIAVADSAGNIGRAEGGSCNL
jgi:N-acetylmuramic acid 6-phosphate etherase